MRADQQTFSKILQSENGHDNYHVPKYQRAYSWNKENWAQIYNDIDENTEGHFIGSIICIDHKATQGAGNDRIFELIDGQQRMTTLSLMLMAIHNKVKSLDIKNLPEDTQDEIKARLRSIRNQVIKKVQSDVANQTGCIKFENANILLRVQPSTQNQNLDDYLYIACSSDILTEKFEKPRHFGNRLMAKAFEYFVSTLPNDITELLEFASKINSLQLVHIIVASHSDAFRLFETLNNRGVPLTAVDIIKNKILAEMEQKCGISIDKAYHKWQEMLKHIEGIEDRFLRHFYNAFKHNKDIEQQGFTKATSSTLIHIYEKTINKNPNFIFSELIAKAEIYGKITQPDENTQLGKALADLNLIGATPSHALLMYLMALDPSKFAKEDTILNFVFFLQKYFVRRNITDIPSTRDLDQLQIDVINFCQTQIGKTQLIDIEFLATTYCKDKGQPASLSVFEENLSDNLFYYNKPMARYVLVKLDECAHTREYKPNLNARNNKGKYIWTVEHVFPQGENIPKEWVDMIANGDEAEAKEIQNDWVHCLGNLTLSAYNSKLSNSDFKRKQNKAEKNIAGITIDIGYKNGLYLNNLEFKADNGAASLSTISSWTKESIEERNSKIVMLLCDQYRFDHKIDDNNQ
ncbi:MAG: DUF262 domain-containing protein [Alphaproteobacteria bacterium]